MLLRTLTTVILLVTTSVSAPPPALADPAAPRVTAPPVTHPAPPTPADAPAYRLSTIPHHRAGLRDCTPLDMNVHHDVILRCLAANGDHVHHALVGGRIVTLSTTGPGKRTTTNPRPTLINDRGDIAGTVIHRNPGKRARLHAALWDRTGKMRYLSYAEPETDAYRLPHGDSPTYLSNRGDMVFARELSQFYYGPQRFDHVVWKYGEWESVLGEDERITGISDQGSVVSYYGGRWIRSNQPAVWGDGATGTLTGPEDLADPNDPDVRDQVAPVGISSDGRWILGFDLSGMSTAGSLFWWDAQRKTHRITAGLDVDWGQVLAFPPVKVTNDGRALVAGSPGKPGRLLKDGRWYDDTALRINRPTWADVTLLDMTSQGELLAAVVANGPVERNIHGSRWYAGALTPVATASGMKALPPGRDRALKPRYRLQAIAGLDALGPNCRPTGMLPRNALGSRGIVVACGAPDGPTAVHVLRDGVATTMRYPAHITPRGYIVQPVAGRDGHVYATWASGSTSSPTYHGAVHWDASAHGHLIAGTNGARVEEVNSRGDILMGGHVRLAAGGGDGLPWPTRLGHGLADDGSLVGTQEQGNGQAPPMSRPPSGGRRVESPGARRVSDGPRIAQGQAPMTYPLVGHYDRAITGPRLSPAGDGLGWAIGPTGTALIAEELPHGSWPLTLWRPDGSRLEVPALMPIQDYWAYRPFAVAADESILARTSSYPTPDLYTWWIYRGGRWYRLDDLLPGRRLFGVNPIGVLAESPDGTLVVTSQDAAGKPVGAPLLATRLP